MFNITGNYEIARKLASQGMVLLKNENHVLPFKNGDRVGIVGKKCLDLIRGGGGSAAVNCEYVRTLHEGLLEKVVENKVLFYQDSVDIAKNTEHYTIELLNDMAKHMDKAIITLKRFGEEGGVDRQLGENYLMDEDKDAYQGETSDSIVDDAIDEYAERTGYFYPSKRELKFLDMIEQSEIENVVLLLNISSIVDLSFIQKYTKIKSVLLTYLPGMECGTAIADVLCGDVNPSGKLVDTVAYSYEDYPSSECFDYDPYVTEYKEGIYVGYRYFETFAKDKVLYPFGFGLSYTEFEYTNCSFDEKDGTICLSVDVKNKGKVSGREIVQAYISAPKGKLDKPYIELKGYKKTKELMPGEIEKVEISFTLKDMASFDAEGVTGYKAAWVLEQGDYELFVGKSIRDLFSCGSLHITEIKNMEQLQIRFDGSEYVFSEKKMYKSITKDATISLYDVTDGKDSLEDFISQLTVEELVDLAQGQPPSFPYGTAGIGNLKKYGVVNAQTADGPAGIRRSIPTTCFPCSTLIACSWDEELQFQMGKAMGYEGVNTDIDILLAPAMNIHRDPRCGRNFEYLSEDPLVTGKTASAIVKGVQSEGLLATIKHLVANNCEYYRKYNNSIVSERALREIYLKGFEICIKESNPAFVMTSYNLLNGLYTAAHPQLLRGVLRDEWGYEGAVMTDWRVFASLTDEILSGNNIQMPFGYPDEAEKAIDAYHDAKLSIDILQENAYYVLKAIMKTERFTRRDFGITHNLSQTSVVPAIEFNGTSSTRVQQKNENGEWYLSSLGTDPRGQRTFLYYSINVEDEGEYQVICKASTNCPQSEMWFFDESNKKLGTIYFELAIDENQWYNLETNIYLHEGENTLKIMFANEPTKDCPYSTVWLKAPVEDIRFAKMTFAKR